MNLGKNNFFVGLEIKDTEVILKISSWSDSNFGTLIPGKF